MNIYANCLRYRVKKNGKAPIIIFLREKGKDRVKYTTSIEIEPQFFNNISKKFTKGSGNMTLYNNRLDDILRRFQELAHKHPDFSAKELILRYDNKGSNRLFLEYARNLLVVDRRKLAHKTWEMYHHCLNLIERFGPEM